MLDPRQILAALGVKDPAELSPVGGGWDTSLWRVVSADGISYALRVFQPEQATRCHREAVVMRTLREQGLPVPAVQAESVEGEQPALLLEWCPGQPILNQIQARPWRVWHLGRAMGRVHAQLHQLPVPDALAGELPRVAQDVPGSGSRFSIVHMDFHPLNVMSDGNEVTGVLDWANVGVGDPRADLARTVTLLRLAPMPPDVPATLQRASRALLEVAWRQGYRALLPIEGLDPFYVWAGELMERDLRPKLGRPGVWLQETDLLRIRRWTAARKARLRAQ